MMSSAIKHNRDQRQSNDDTHRQTQCGENGDKQKHSDISEEV